MTQQTQSRHENAVNTETAAEAASSKKAIDSKLPKAGRTLTPEDRHCMIAEAAYLIAEQRGFQGDAALDDWLRAEADINAHLPVIE